MTTAALQKHEDDEAAAKAAALVKTRKCLRCLADFDSAWPGERVCGGCKKTSAWRSGVSSTPATNRR